MATTHCGPKMGGGVLANTESLVTKRKMEKMDSEENLFLPQTLSSLGWEWAL